MRTIKIYVILAGFSGHVSYCQENRGEIFDALAGVVSYVTTKASENPYKNSSAQVRVSKDICLQEQAFLDKRSAFIRTKLQERVNSEIGNKKIPTVAFICSGGGYRAMLYTVGGLCAAQQTGLLDYASYVVGLSGSTWAIASWLSSKKSLQEFRNWLIDNLCLSIKDVDDEDILLAWQIIFEKYWAGQPIGFVDFYGAFIANDIFDFFSADKKNVYLSEQATQIEEGTVPFPVYTAISGDCPPADACWYEFTPYEANAKWLNMYVPTWAFGRKFEKGLSVSFDAEQPLSTLLGTFGLAIGGTVQQLLANSTTIQSIKASVIKKIIEKITQNFGNNRPVYAEYYNFMKGVDEGLLATAKTIRLVDAGLAMNIPYPAVCGHSPSRTADIIVILDASAGTVGEELKNVQHYALKQGLKLPPISYTDIEKHAYSVFKDDTDSTIPIIIYIPRIVDETLLLEHKNDLLFAGLYDHLHGLDMENSINSGPFNTFNFFYSKKEAHDVVMLGECNMKCAYNAVLEAIINKIS